MKCIAHNDSYVENSTPHEGSLRNRECEIDVKKCKEKRYKCIELKNCCLSGVEKQVFRLHVRPFNAQLRNAAYGVLCFKLLVRWF